MTTKIGSRWPQILLIYLLGVFAVAVISVAVPEVGGIARELHPQSPAVIGLVISMPALVAALGALIIGSLVDRFGDRTVLITGGFILIAGDIGVALSHSVPVLLQWRVVGGVGYVCMAVAAVTMMTRLTAGPGRTVALTLWSTVIPASFIVALIGGGMLLAPGAWRSAFGSHAAITGILLVLGMLFLPARNAGEAVFSRTAGVGLVMRSFWPYVLGISFAANAALQTGVIASLPQMLARSIGASEGLVHSFNVLAMLINIVGALSVGAMLNKGIPALTVGLSGVLLCGLACLGLTLMPTGFAEAMTMNCVFMLVAPSPQTLGATSGLITQITLVGVLFGPPAALFSLSKGPVGFLVFAAIALAASLIGLPVWLKAGNPTGQDRHHGVAVNAH